MANSSSRVDRNISARRKEAKTEEAKLPESDMQQGPLAVQSRNGVLHCD
ncbi:hypothetical protein [Bradyrhizobium iriomotense]|nr:hypothetical protein [Bradyrhizobium iriomotense]MBR1126870.1 hypothetical protein [Bradyrhizobium iriomotense]